MNKQLIVCLACNWACAREAQRECSPVNIVKLYSNLRRYNGYIYIFHLVFLKILSRYMVIAEFKKIQIQIIMESISKTSIIFH